MIPLSTVAAALPLLTEAEVEELAALDAADRPPDSLTAFFARARPDLAHPEHLWARGVNKHGDVAASLGETLEATLRGPQMATFSTPPQFGKSILVLAALVWYAARVPGSESAYVSYGDEIAHTQSDKARKMAERVGLRPMGTKSVIKLANGSTIRFTSAGGTLEGNPITGIAVYDDPYKSRAVAESPVERETIRGWFFSTFLGRTHRTTSVIVIGHRWTADDLITQIEEAGFPWTNYPALWPDGRSLWESFKSAEWLGVRKATVGPVTWESEYQGKPMASGGRQFEGVEWYTAEQLPPRHLLKVAIGVDLAYSERTASDWSVAVVLGQYNERWYLLKVIRDQCKADVWAQQLKRLSAEFPGAHMRWDGSTTERGAADAIRVLGKIPLQGVLAVGNAYGRSLLVAAAWRRKAVLCPFITEAMPPEQILALTEFIRVVTTFAQGASEDDDVAALASAFEQLPAKAVPPPVAFNSPEWIAAEQARTQQAMIKQVREQSRAQERQRSRGRE